MHTLFTLAHRHGKTARQTDTEPASQPDRHANAQRESRERRHRVNADTDTGKRRERLSQTEERETLTVHEL